MNKKAVSILLVVTVAVFCIISGRAQSTNGVAGSMPAYYDGELFTINFKELPPGGETANLTHNGSINIIYMSDEDPSFISGPTLSLSKSPWRRGLPTRVQSMLHRPKSTRGSSKICQAKASMPD